VLLLGAEMNAVVEHMSNEGKDVGEKEVGDGGVDSTAQNPVSGLGRDHSVPEPMKADKS
jgi:membrane protein